jgi:hypothetical protein
VQAVGIEGAEHADDGSIVGTDCVRPKLQLVELGRFTSCHVLEGDRLQNFRRGQPTAVIHAGFQSRTHGSRDAAPPLAMDIKISGHAREAMLRRGLSEHDVLAVAHHPEQQIDIRPGRVLAQAIRRLVGNDDRVYLLRVVIDMWPDGPEIVTAHKTTQIPDGLKGDVSCSE